jgi:phage tail-like protein
MTQSVQTGTFFELDPIIGWREAKIDALSPVSSSMQVSECVSGRQVIECSPDLPTLSTTRLPVEPSYVIAPASGGAARQLDLGSGLAVDCVPGQPRRFARLVADQFIYPIALARGGGLKKLYLLDDGIDRVRAVDLEEQKEVKTIAGFGGEGKGGRQLRSPRGFAVLEDGAFVIADTGNHQVKIFSTFPHALLSVWGSGRPGNGPAEFNQPWKVVADPCGLIYIADRGNGRIQRIRRDGSTESPVGGLESPTGLALGSAGTLAVLDRNNVLIFARGQTTVSQTLAVPDASCITLDSGGYLYVGTSSALIHKFAPTGAAQFRGVGIGVTGMDAQFIDLLWTQDLQLVGILLEKCVARPTLWSLSTCGAYLAAGSLTTQTFDSGIENCTWHRVQLDAAVPQGTIIEVSTQTSETNTNTYKETDPWSEVSTLSLTGNDPDCLVQSPPGRYLRMQVLLKTNGIASPLLCGARIYFPRESYLQYLPAIYQEDDESSVFLDRFLSIFQTTFDALDHRIDDMWKLFDPLSTPDKWYAWLASWLALPINPVWTNRQRRAALKSAGRVYPKRGTLAGVEELIKEYCCVDARLVEHFRLRQLLILSDQPSAKLPDQPSTETVLGGSGRLWSRDYYQRLQLGVYSRVGYFRLTGEPEPGIEPLAWGANEFTVFFNCDPYQVDETQQSVAEVVEREKPAYTKANYAPVFPRMRVGVQSTLGVDTRVGMIAPLLLGATGTLGYDSILGGSTIETHLRSQNGTLRPQVDVNTRLL